jgi:hypothetical protein
MAEVTQIAERFSVLERFLLLNGVLPAKGDISTIRLLRRVREALSFSEEEHVLLNIRSGAAPGLMVWDDPNAHMKRVEIGPKVRELIATGLKALSEAGQLSDQHLGLCDRFLAEEGAAEEVA